VGKLRLHVWKDPVIVYRTNVIKQYQVLEKDINETTP